MHLESRVACVSFSLLLWITTACSYARAEDEQPIYIKNMLTEQIVLFFDLELVGPVEPGSTIRFVPGQYRDETLEQDGKGVIVFASVIRNKSEHLVQEIIWKTLLRKDRGKSAYFWFGGKSTSVTIDTETGVKTVQAEREITAADIDSAGEIKVRRRGKFLPDKPSKPMIPDEVKTRLKTTFGSFASGYEGSSLVEGERGELDARVVWRSNRYS